MADYLIHYGVSGQKWGTRRYQNEDGSLTPEGREHYGVSEKQIKKFESGKKDYIDYVKKNRSVGKYLNKSENRKAFIEASKKHREVLNEIYDESDKRARAARMKLDPDSEKKLYTTKLDQKVWEAGNKAAEKYMKTPEVQKKLKQTIKEYEESYKKYQDDAEKIISKVLGNYGNTRDKYNRTSKNKEAAERIVGQDLDVDKYRKYTSQRRLDKFNTFKGNVRIKFAKIMY